jgi:hypothetical protein
MKALSAGLTFVSISTVCGLLFGIGCGGLDVSTAIWSLMLGGFAAIIAYWSSSDTARPAQPVEVPAAEPAPRLSKRAQRRMEKGALQPTAPPKRGYRNIWIWIMAAFFAIFAVRSFCWLLYIDSGELKIQSPNNLGDLSLHITYIRNFANGVPLWPDNPIYAFSKMRYPAGIDLFNALLLLANVDLIPGLVWVGILASIATCYAFYRWGGAFGIAGFLFNGGLAGFQFLSTWQFQDYQTKNDIAWKSIPLAMFVTQRGLLYAIPAGLFLLWHWREKFFRPAEAGEDRHRMLLPFWAEIALYASMPLFHVHTFMALSIVLVFLFLFGDRAMQRHTFRLVACSFLPATLFVWLITDHFNAGSVLQWWPGWVLHNKAGNEFHHAFLWFWLWNFGLFMPLLLILFGVVGSRMWESGIRFRHKAPEDFIFLAAAVFIFLLGFFFKTAPWEWDNLKLMIWGYFLVLPYLWKDLIRPWPVPGRVAICIALFASGFVSLFGGLAAGRTGFGFVQRAELDGIGVAVRKLPAEARFATFPIFNHPILLQGRKVVLGYPGHLWTQGFDFGDAQNKLTQLMNGASNWRENARALRVRYIFWGNFEKTNYPTSTRPWEKELPRVAGDGWGAIYDLGPTP